MYTWGNLRLLLQQFAPGVSLDAIDSYLNTRYQQVLDHYEWSGLRATATIETRAARLSTADTVTVAAGSANVTGAATAWTDAITGLKFFCAGDNQVYTATYVSATALTLDRGYEGPNPGAGKSYGLYQDTYALPADCKTVTEVLDAVTGLPLGRFEQTRLDGSAGPLSFVADPRAWSVTDDSSEATPPVEHEIRFYPPPIAARGYPVRYRRAAFGFTGANTFNAALPWVTDTVLLYGPKADILADQKDYAGAQMYEMKFGAELAKMVREDCRRNPPPPLKMAGRYTRHRLERVSRGYWSGWRGGTPGGPG